MSAYIAQQTLSVLTPAFFAAAHFSILGLCLVMFGQEYSLVSPHLIVPFFVGVDIVSLIAQGTGSGMAAVAEQALPPQSTIPGAWIVVGGLASQLVGYLLFNILFVNFVVKAVRNPPQHPLWSSKMKLFLVMVWISSLLVFARSVFRTIELTMGWIGREYQCVLWHLVDANAPSPSQRLPRRSGAFTPSMPHRFRWPS